MTFRRPTPRGFSLVVALMIMVLVAGGLALLSGMASQLEARSNDDLVEAMQRNLAASALSWCARQDGSVLRGTSADDPVTLDVTALEIPDATVTLWRGDSETVHIRTRFTRATRNVDLTRTYRLD
jgi:hypothetical protein